MMLIQVAPGQSLQTVIDALPADDQPVTIHLAPGVYEEKSRFAARTPALRAKAPKRPASLGTTAQRKSSLTAKNAARSARQRCSSMPATAHSAT